MNAVYDAEPGDIYAEPSGKLWRIVGVCREPTVIAEEVEGHIPSAPGWGSAVGMVAGPIPTSPPTIIKNRISGGIGGFMWEGFARIWREPKRETSDTFADPRNQPSVG